MNRYIPIGVAAMVFATGLTGLARGDAWGGSPEVPMTQEEASRFVQTDSFAPGHIPAGLPEDRADVQAAVPGGPAPTCEVNGASNLASFDDFAMYGITPYAVMSKEQLLSDPDVARDAGIVADIAKYPEDVTYAFVDLGDGYIYVATFDAAGCSTGLYTWHHAFGIAASTPGDQGVTNPGHIG
jgi:hypothetical protein